MIEDAMRDMGKMIGCMFWLLPVLGSAVLILTVVLVVVTHK